MKDNTVSPEIEAAFTELLALAGETLDNAPGADMSQAIALRTAAGSTHAFFTTLAELPAAEERVLADLTAGGDTRVSFLVALWESRCVDLPAYSLREKLIALDRRNLETLLVLQGEGHLSIRTLGSTMAGQ